MTLGAIVLTGGRGSRLGGVDKGALLLDGRTLLDRALEALQDVPTVVVGPSAPAGVSVVREEPPFAGPAAAVVAGLGALSPQVEDVLLLAVDVLGLPCAVPLLRHAAGGADGVAARDPDGRIQWLLGRYRVAPLRAAAAALGDPQDASLRALLGGLDLASLPLPGDLTADVDTVADARAAGVTVPAPREEEP